MTLSAKNLDNRLVEFVGPTTMKSVHLYFIQNYITTVYFIFNIYLNSNIVYMTFIFWSLINSNIVYMTFIFWSLINSLLRSISFFIVCLYLYCIWDPVTSLTPPHCCACSKQGSIYPLVYVIVFNDLKCDAVVHFVNTFLYWWNCWSCLKYLFMNKSKQLSY